MSNSESLVKTASHRGFEYSIKVAVGNEWRDGLGKFFAKCPFIPFEQFDSMALAETHAKKHIDIFLDNNPSDWDAWMELFEECMVWSGYEDCELDSKILKEVANKYAKFVNTSTKIDNDLIDRLDTDIEYESNKDLTKEWTAEYREGFTDGLKRAKGIIQ